VLDEAGRRRVVLGRVGGAGVELLEDALCEDLAQLDPLLICRVWERVGSVGLFRDEEVRSRRRRRRRPTHRTS